MTGTSISQEALEIPGGLGWTEGDPVSLIFLVDVDWEGNYQAQIREARSVTSTLVGTFTVTTEYDSLTYPLETLFTLTLSAEDAALIPAGKKYFTDIQQVDGVTRLWACIEVRPQITVIE